MQFVKIDKNAVVNIKFTAVFFVFLKKLLSLQQLYLLLLCLITIQISKKRKEA